MVRRLPNDITALASTPLFRDLTKRELDAVQRNGTVVDLGPGRRVRCPLQHPAQFAVIVWGEVFAYGDTGHRRVLGPGEWFCSDFLGRDGAAPESFETVGHTTLFVMNRREFLGLRAVCPRVAARVSGLLDEAREVHIAPGPRAGSLVS